jgi:hypothetical protein
MSQADIRDNANRYANGDGHVNEHKHANGDGHKHGDRNEYGDRNGNGDSNEHSDRNEDANGNGNGNGNGDVYANGDPDLYQLRTRDREVPGDRPGTFLVVILKSVLSDGQMVTIVCDVIGNPAPMFPAGGEYLGSVTVRLLAETPAGIVAGVIRQEAATVYEDAIRGAELRHNLEVMDLEKD